LNRLIRTLIVSMIAFVTATSAFAHHSFSSEFDINKPVTLRGKLTKLDWINPHAWLYIDVKGDDDKIVNWAIETGGPNNLLRRGLRKTDFPIGTEIVVQGYAAKNGTHTADGRNITFADGRKFFGGTPGDGGPEDGQRK
jgi:Family of unknown function (DUF6152)